jgi:hypothetical protein
MAQNTKIIPTIAEREAAMDTNFFDIKRTLTGKIIDGMGLLGDSLTHDVVNPAISAIGYRSVQAKISRGENFNGYPYIVLDCPRLNDTHSEVICRTIFWWGHSWSLHFALQGSALQHINYQRVARLSNNWQVYTGDNLWEQHPAAHELIPVHSPEKDYRQKISSRAFFKICQSVSLAKAQEWPPFPIEEYKQVFQLIT